MRYIQKAWLFFYLSFVFAQNDTLQSLRLFPLKIGQEWQYQEKHKHYWDGYEFTLHYLTVDVTNDTIMPNNKRYFIVNNAAILNMGTYLRVDSTELLVKAYNENCDDLEATIFDLSTIDSAPTFCDTTDSTLLFHYTFDSTMNQVGILDEFEARIWRFMPPIIDNLCMSENFGISTYEWGDRGTHTIYNLFAANLDSIQYGNFVHPRISYYPLSVGNKWQYHTTEWYFGEDTLNYITNIEILNDTLINNNLWFQFEEIRPNQVMSSFMRIDSASAIVYELMEDNTECTLYNLNLSDGDVFSETCYYFHQLTEIWDFDVLIGFIVKRIQYDKQSSFFSDDNTVLSPGYGMTKRLFSPGGVDGFIKDSLIAVDIDDNQLGHFLQIEPVETILPIHFSLQQPYPNPFNANVKIKIKINKKVHLRIAIMDINGREVYTISNQTFESGEFSFIWEAANYSSGIYFISAITEKFSENRKIILIK